MNKRTPPTTLDARYVITLADLQQLRKAQMIASLALEPKPGYKPASREIMATALKCCVDVIEHLELDDYIPAQIESFDDTPERRVVLAAEKVSDYARKGSDFGGPGDELDALCELSDAVGQYRAGESGGTDADPQNQADSIKPEPTGFNSLPGLSSQTVAHSIFQEATDAR